MKIIGLLSFYDESPSWLATVVAGMGRFCDAVVAVDGGYKLFPGARPRSMPDQGEAIVLAAEAADLGLILHKPKDIWHGNEIQKRNQTLALAGTICEPGIDWLVVFDSDMHLMKCNPEALRWDLENTRFHVATMTVQEGKDMLADPAYAEAAQLIGVDYEWNTKQRLLYRYHPSLKYGPMHWCVSRKVGRKTEWLWGPQELGLARALDLEANLVCYHRSQDRAYLRRQAADVYYQTRDAFKVESSPVEAAKSVN